MGALTRVTANNKKATGAAKPAGEFEKRKSKLGTAPASPRARTPTRIVGCAQGPGVFILEGRIPLKTRRVKQPDEMQRALVRNAPRVATRLAFLVAGFGVSCW